MEKKRVLNIVLGMVAVAALVVVGAVVFNTGPTTPPEAARPTPKPTLPPTTALASPTSLVRPTSTATAAPDPTSATTTPPVTTPAPGGFPTITNGPEYPAQFAQEGLFIRPGAGTPLVSRETALKAMVPHSPGDTFTIVSDHQIVINGQTILYTAKLGDNIRLNSPVERLDGDKTVHLASGEKIEAEAVILTVPTVHAARLTQSLAPALAANLKEIPTLGSATVSFGYREADLPGPLDGFGFVVAASEPTHLLASTWSSTKLPGRAPAGHALLRVFFGGHRHEADVDLPDEALIALAKDELRQVMNIEAAPVISRIFRWRQANPQYKIGHLDRLAEMENGQTPPWLRLAGSPYRGIGIPDCVNQGRKAAKALLGVE